MPAATWFEAALAIDTNGDDLASRRFDEAVRRLRIELIDFTPEHAEQAREAWHMYGWKRHPAQLNMGDCFAYACARAQGAPLLFKGEDFSKTDVNDGGS